MATLQDHFCLTRPNFQLNPKQTATDRTIFFGDEEHTRLIEEIDSSYLGGDVPKYYMWGNYGTGKTHLLYYLKHYYENNHDVAAVVPLVVQMEAQSNTRYQSLHRRFLDALTPGKLSNAYSQFRARFVDFEEREAAVTEIFPAEDARRALHFLEPGPAQAIAWKWLTGERLNNSEQASIGVVGGARETGDLIELLVQIGDLFQRTGENLLFLIDESESLHNVSNDDAQTSWHDALRRLAGEDNRSIGWIMTFYATDNDEPPAFTRHGDILDRLGDRGIIVRDPLEPTKVEKFLGDLFLAFVDQEQLASKMSEQDMGTDAEHYPFTEAAYEVFLGEAKDNPDRAIPRTIIRALTSCAIEALKQGELVITADIVASRAPQEFVPRVN
jgi:hypothetical protein